MSLLTVIWSFSLLFPTIHATTATITGVPAYSSQRPCAHRCFYVGGSFDGGADLLANNIGCDVDPIENECICRPDIQPLAHSHLSSCVNDRCDSMTVDLNSAVSIYDDYCSSNGYTAESPAPTTTTGTQPPSAAVTVTIVETVAAGGAAPDSHPRAPLFGLLAGLAALFL